VRGNSSAGRQLRFDASLQRGREPSGEASLAAEGRLGLDGAGRGSSRISAELGAGFDTRCPWRSSLALRWRSPGRSLGRASVGLEAEALLADGADLELRGAVVLWRPGYHLYCRLRAPIRRAAEALSVVLGWQTRVSQPRRRSSRAVWK
jgi:hypothetical protein